jgi:hypothetical protein
MGKLWHRFQQEVHEDGVIEKIEQFIEERGEGLVGYEFYEDGTMSDVIEVPGTLPYGYEPVREESSQQ